MPAEKLYSEIFDDFEGLPNRKERVEYLRKYSDKAFTTFLEMTFNKDIQFDVEALPNTYRPALEPAGLNYTYLNLEIPKLYRFIKNHPSKPEGLTREKQEKLLLVILEALHADEARLFVGMFAKDLKVRYLTAKLVKEVFPQLNI